MQLVSCFVVNVLEEHHKYNHKNSEINQYTYHICIARTSTHSFPVSYVPHYIHVLHTFLLLMIICSVVLIMLISQHLSCDMVGRSPVMLR